MSASQARVSVMAVRDDGRPPEVRRAVRPPAAKVLEPAYVRIYREDRHGVRQPTGGVQCHRRMADGRCRNFTD